MVIFHSGVLKREKERQKALENHLRREVLDFLGLLRKNFVEVGMAGKVDRKLDR